MLLWPSAPLITTIVLGQNPYPDNSVIPYSLTISLQLQSRTCGSSSGTGDATTGLASSAAEVSDTAMGTAGRTCGSPLDSSTAENAVPMLARHRVVRGLIGVKETQVLDVCLALV